MSEEKTKKCLCYKPLCAKCLGVNCKDDNCKVHTIENKSNYKKRIVQNLKLTVIKINKLIKNGYTQIQLNELYDYRRLPKIKIEIEEYIKEIKRLERLNL